MLPAAKAQIIHSWNFERWPSAQRLSSTAYDGWTGNDNNTTRQSRGVASPAGSPLEIGSQSLFLFDNDATTNPNAQFNLESNLATGYLEFSLRRETGTSGSIYLRFRDIGSSTNNMQLYINQGSSTIRFVAYEGGTATVDNSVSYETAGYTDFAWSTFRIYFDEAAQTASVFVNGTLVSGLSITGTSGLALRAGNFVFLAGDTTSINVGAYIDNVTVTAVPEPSSAALMISGGLFLAICVRWRSRQMAGFKA
jgi:hypothetical protein